LDDVQLLIGKVQVLARLGVHLDTANGQWQKPPMLIVVRIDVALRST
jgi:hypothetical protein